MSVRQIPKAQLRGGEGRGGKGGGHNTGQDNSDNTYHATTKKRHVGDFGTSIVFVR